jgi:hypothetical protein
MLLVSLECLFLIAPSIFSNVYFVLCIVCPMLLVSLECPFLIDPSIFSSVYFVLCIVFPMLFLSLECPFLIGPSIFSNVYFVLCIVCPLLLVSLECLFLIAPSIFSNVYFVLCIVCPMLLVSLEYPFLIALLFSLTFISSCVLCTQCCQVLCVVYSIGFICLHKTQNKDKQNTKHREPGMIGHTRQRTKTNKTDRIDNPETLATLDTGRMCNQEWTTQRHWQHWTHKTQDEGAIKNEQPRDTGNSWHTRHMTKVQSRMNNPETLATLDTQDTGRRCNQECTTQRHWQHWTQVECAIKNEQPRDTGNTGHTRHRTKVQSRMSNPETLATLDTQNTGRRCNQEWTTQRHWQHWTHKKTQDEGAIKNEQPRW